MLKPKVGDLVRAKPFKVVKVFMHDGGFVECFGGGFVECFGGTNVAFDEIEEILPRPLVVGDRVRHTGPYDIYTGEIVAVRQDIAFVDWGSQRYGPLSTMQLLNDLRRIDEP